MPDVSGTPLVVPPDLETAGTELNKQAQGIADELHDLWQELNPISDLWVGPASSYYQPLMSDWNKAADGLFAPTGVLGQIAHALNMVWNNYSECEWANVKAWQR